MYFYRFSFILLLLSYLTIMYFLNCVLPSFLHVHFTTEALNINVNIEENPLTRGFFSYTNNFNLSCLAYLLPLRVTPDPNNSDIKSIKLEGILQSRRRRTRKPLWYDTGGRYLDPLNTMSRDSILGRVYGRTYVRRVQPLKWILVSRRISLHSYVWIILGYKKKMIEKKKRCRPFGLIWVSQTHLKNIDLTTLMNL